MQKNKWFIIFLIVFLISRTQQIQANPPGWSEDYLLTAAQPQTAEGYGSPVIAKAPDGGINIVFTRTLGFPITDIEIYYAKQDGTGKPIIPSIPLIRGNFNDYPTIAVDRYSTIHLAWGYTSRTSNTVKYAKFNQNGNRLSQDRTISNVGLSVLPSMRIHQDNVYIVWQGYIPAGRLGIYLTKLDTNGNPAINNRVLVNPLFEARKPSLTISDDDILNVVWYDSRDGNWQLYYARFSSSDGTRVTQDQRITNTQGETFDPRSELDQDGNLHIAWSEEYRFPQFVRKAMYKKIDPRTGRIIIPDTVISMGYNNAYTPDISIDSYRNVHSVWRLIDEQQGIFPLMYTKLDNNGNRVIEQQLTTDQRLGLYSDILADGQDVHIAFEATRIPETNGDVYYKRSLGLVQFRGSFRRGETSFIDLFNPLYPNSNYFFAMALDRIPGIMLPDGRTVYLNLDPFFFLAITNYALIGLSNIEGVLDSQGAATITWRIPADAPPYLALNGAFLIIDRTLQFPQSIQYISVSYPTTIQP